MSQDIRDFVPASCGLLALGEPTHLEPAFAQVRNEVFGQLAELGFRSIALETDRVAALTVNDFVHDGIGTLDTAMSQGFSHGFGELDANRQLVAWMREHNAGLAREERLTFHGFDAPTENMSAPSPQRYLEHARDYLGLDLDLDSLIGDDERWSRTAAILDPTASVGDTADAARLRSIAEDMLTSLHARAPELIAATSRADWLRAETLLTAGLGLLHYHRQAAQRIDETTRIHRLLTTRDVIMAHNLLAIRDTESRRGPTLVFANNVHLQRNRSTMHMRHMVFDWFGAGAIVASLKGEQYTFVAGSLGRSDTIGLGEPEPDTFEATLQGRIGTWGLAPAATVASARTRTDHTPRQGYFPLDQATLDAADAVLHVNH
jgi:erythromycin esterase-like protein